MQNPYDLLGVRPDDDAESLRKAYHKAAKASHPDHHGGDPEAAARFRQIAQAYDILRDAAKRAAYDQFLAVELEVRRRPLRTKLKRTLSGLKRHLVTDAIIGVVLTIVLAGGYELFARMPETPIQEADRMMAHEPGGIAAVQRAGQNGEAGRGRLTTGTAAQMPILIPVVSGDTGLAADGGSVVEMATGEPDPHPAVRTIEAVKGDGISDVPADQAITKASAGDPGKDQGDEPHPTPPGDGQFLAPEKHDGGRRTASSGNATSDVKRDGKTPEMAGATSGDAKRAEIRGATRPPAARGRPVLQEASLDSRHASAACASSPACAGDRPPRADHPPPLFGVGF
jgi:hypothetical protein